MVIGMLGFAILIGFNLLGLILQHWLHIPLPANVIGLILFVMALSFKIIKLEWVEETAQFLLRHMMLFFAPIIVGTIVFFTIFGEQWLPIILSLVGSTIIVLIVTGWITNTIVQNEDKEKRNVEKNET